VISFSPARHVDEPDPPHAAVRRHARRHGYGTGSRAASSYST